MTKIEIDSDVSMLTNKQLINNISKFLDSYKNILVDNMRDPKVYDDPYIERDVRSLKKVFNVIKKQIKEVIMMEETQGENLCPKKRKY